MKLWIPNVAQQNIIADPSHSLRNNNRDVLGHLEHTRDPIIHVQDGKPLTEHGRELLIQKQRGLQRNRSGSQTKR